MGSSESKICASKQVKPEPAIKNMRHLVDPRSPSVSVDRTPIQVKGFLPRTDAEVKSLSPLVLTDPRSPTVGITRTPIRDAMRATVGTFARRLGMLFHSEIDGQVAESPEQEPEGEAVAQVDPAADQPLLSPQPSQTLSSLAEHADILDTPVVPSVHSAGDVSPFLLLAEPQLEVELETEADLSLEEGEEAKESPLNNRLSLSLITCHEGAMSSEVFADVHCDGLSFLAPRAEEELEAEGVDHSYARPVPAVEPEPLVDQPTDECVPPAQASAVLTEGEKDLAKEASSPSAAAPSESATVLTAQQPQPSTNIPCLKIDPKSPSQVVFKPQWLGNGFGTNKPRVKSVQQGQFGKGGSSPLAVRVAVKNMSNENKGQSGKRKQKGTDGRSPLQILKGANSPRSQQPQMKLKVSTPDKQRMGQVDSRLLPVSLDKENR